MANCDMKLFIPSWVQGVVLDRRHEHLIEFSSGYMMELFRNMQASEIDTNGLTSLATCFIVLLIVILTFADLCCVKVA